MSETLSGRDVLRLLADGVSVEELEVQSSAVSGVWYPLDKNWLAVGLAQSVAKFRRKHKNRWINGWAVPEPIQEQPQRGQKYYLASPYFYEWCFGDAWNHTEIDKLRFERGLIFYDREAAIANAKAMCGINPYAKG